MSARNPDSSDKVQEVSAQGRFTRGRGLLEPFLARQRAHMANRLIPAALRRGRILDIGCGTFPYFLAHTAFADKFAIDQLPMPEEVSSRLRIDSHSLNLNQAPSLPFPDTFTNTSADANTAKGMAKLGTIPSCAR